MNNFQALSRATKDLMLTEPFYGLFLLMMNKKWSTSISTAGVSRRGINVDLTINGNFWESLPANHKKGILKHELQHIAQQHLTLRDRYKNHELFNIAADLEINQYNNRLDLPGGEYSSKEDYEKVVKPIYEDINKRLEAETITRDEAKKEYEAVPIRVLFLEDFPDLNLDERAGTDYYYKKLEETMDDKGNSSSPSLDQLLKGNNPFGDQHFEHMTWKEFEGLSESEKKLIKKQIDYTLKEVADQISKSNGHIPSELKDYIDSLSFEEPPKFDWRGYLRKFTGGSIKTYTKKTRRKLSKRFEGNPGLKIKQKKHILVGIDTSGSVSQEELQMFFHEIYHIHKTGAEVTVVECDAAISRIRKYTKPEDGKIDILGRGGTSFQPIVDYYNKHKQEYSCLVYLTDGWASPPSPTAEGRMLWVLSNESDMGKNLPGPSITLN